ncbi:MAG TPA: 50S ribosomal protein L15 [Candidatus Aminicenantes bacterium]|nr:50S ribosomal protein L15 [Candidatus Aminicenantes bacterium]HRY65484.1 50S ribosomal protein L15 [Candidatus Aminicenantes bacterium]HRZ72048.1 50S ribosomal protein L15 [Candidatus Aminicenantes bacterium]
MNLSNLKPAPGSRKGRKRVGRGPGSGHGKTAGAGSKGQLQGSGYSRLPGFEGGQMPLTRRIPKRGFTNIFRQETAVVNLDRLAKIRKDEIGPAEMAEHRLIPGAGGRVKVLGRGDLASAKTVRAHEFSASAQRKIEAKGGRAVVIGKD